MKSKRKHKKIAVSCCGPVTECTAASRVLKDGIYKPKSIRKVIANRNGGNGFFIY